MIPHHSHVATELTALTKKGAKFKWTPNCQAAFDTLKLELAKSVMLAYPNFSKTCRECQIFKRQRKHYGKLPPKHRIPHEYHVGDKILIRKQIDKLGKLQCPTQGPFVIVEVQDLPFNSTVVIDKGSYKEKINIRHILPFFLQSS